MRREALRAYPCRRMVRGMLNVRHLGSFQDTCRRQIGIASAETPPLRLVRVRVKTFIEGRRRRLSSFGGEGGGIRFRGRYQSLRVKDL